MKIGTRDAGRGTCCLVGVLALLAACGSERTERKDSVDVSRPVSPVSSAPRAARPASRVVLFIGTSLTAGLGLDPDSAYPQLIQRTIDSAGLGYDVVNAGVSGETSAGLVRRLDWLLGQRFDVVVLETGANDGLRGTPVADTRKNIQQVIDRIKATHPAVTLLLVQMEAPPNLGSRYTSAFHAIYPELAKANRIALLPFLLNGVAGHPDLNQADGIHPNTRGEKLVARNVWVGLEPLLRGRADSAERPRR